MTFLALLEQIPDRRRPQGKMFDQPHVLLFCILAIMAGADSYRKMAIFIEEHFATLTHAYALTWKRAPNYNSIRHVIHSLDTEDVERVFRAHAKTLAPRKKHSRPHISLDGKALKHSFDTVADVRFRQILSAFSTFDRIILAHADIGESKENEANAAIRLLEELAIPRALYTLDALHTQKKRCKP